MDDQTKEKVSEYVRKNTREGRDWRSIAETICFMLEKSKFISAKNICYDSEGNVTDIRGMEVRDGILQIKEKKKILKAIIVQDDTPNPLIEQLRESQTQPRSPRKRTYAI